MLGSRRDLGSKKMIAPLCVGILLELGCAGPSIQRFGAEPQVLCEGESANISWDASGELAIAFSSEPALGRKSDCSAAGRDTFEFALVARKRGQEAVRKTEVVQLRESAAEPIDISTTRLDGTDIVAAGEKNPALWTNRVRIATLAVCQHRAIKVLHAGKAVLLPADGTPLDAFSGEELAGSWELRSPLSADEQTHPALRPKDLEVLATIRCTKGTP
jgi:hypothetical protein